MGPWFGLLSATNDCRTRHATVGQWRPENPLISHSRAGRSYDWVRKRMRGLSPAADFDAIGSRLRIGSVSQRLKVSIITNSNRSYVTPFF
jgi:hypothetical protein